MPSMRVTEPSARAVRSAAQKMNKKLMHYKELIIGKLAVGGHLGFCAGLMC